MGKIGLGVVKQKPADPYYSYYRDDLEHPGTRLRIREQRAARGPRFGNGSHQETSYGAAGA